MSEDALTDLLRAGVDDDVFPGAVAHVWREDGPSLAAAAGVVSNHPPGDSTRTDTVYDLASLTKVLCTSLLTALAVGRKQLELDAAVPSAWSLGCPGATLTDLLEHSSGLAAHREYFLDVEPFDRDAVLERVVATPPAYPRRTQAVYSDLGFIILGAWLERVFDRRLDEAFAEHVSGPLGIEARLFFRPLPAEPAPNTIAPTEVYRADLHPGGAPSHFDVRKSAAVAHGEVHDDNCWVMGGVAGHAGLFGDAAAVVTVARAWLDASLPGLNPALRDRFFRPSTVVGSTRRLGFDGPSPDGSGSPGRAVAQSAVGHTGYTGNSLWIDAAARRIYVLLSNRVHPRRTNNAIKRFRPRFHEAAADLL